MAIPLLNTQPLSFEQNTPWLQGLQQGQQVVGQGLQNQGDLLSNISNAIKNQYLAPNLQANLLATQLANQKSQAQLPYAAQDLTSQIAQRLAESNLLGQQAKYFPYTTYANLLAGLGRYKQASYLWSPQNALSKFQNNTSFQNLESQNPQLASAAANVQAQSVAGSGYGMNNVSAPSIPGVNAQSLSQINPNMGNGQAVNVTPDQIKNYQDTAGSQAQLSSTQAPIQQQRVFSNSFDNIYQNQLAPLLPSVTKFAGLGGRTELEAEKLKTGLGFNPSQDYQNYNTFVEGASKLASNEMRRALGGNATDSQIAEMQQLADPAFWFENPKLALQRWNSLIASKYQNDRAIFNSPNQNYQQGMQQIQRGPTTVPNAASGLPKFNNKQEFQSWYSKLPVDQQRQVRQQLGER
jgi:hypothetical protein